MAMKSKNIYSTNLNKHKRGLFDSFGRKHETPIVFKPCYLNRFSG